MVDDVMNIQDELLGAHNLSTSMSGPPPKPLGQPHVLPFDLNTSPIPATSPQSESPRKLQQEYIGCKYTIRILCSGKF